MLARTACLVWIVVHARRARGIAGGRECLMCRDDSFVQLGSLLDVGLDVQLTSRPQEPCDLREEDVAHHEPLRMALLPPRIGEVQEDARDDAVGTETW